LAVLLFLLLVPMPDNRVLPGVAEARRHTPIYSETGGLVSAVPVPSGTWVETGTVLVELSNPELDSELAALAAQIAQTTLLAARTVSEGAVDLVPVQERLRTLSQLKDTLLRQRAALIVRAPHDGYWVAPEVGYRRQAWLARGVELGRVVDDRGQRFVGVIRQEAAALLTQASRQGIEVRLEGELDTAHAASGLVLVPHSHATLPSAALSPVAGGQVPVSAADPSGRQSAEPFFMLLADIESPPGPRRALGVRSGQAGWIRLHMPWRSLAAQAWVGIRQFFQRRYQL
jgi:putative peptide zinc metalloprotease protein